MDDSLMRSLQDLRGKSSNFRNSRANANRPTSQFGGDVLPKGYKTGELQQYLPEQLSQFKDLFGNVGPDSYLSRLAGGDEELFNEMEAPSMRQFQELLGGLSSRFSAGSGRGSLGTRHSSGFQNTGTAAASNFAEQLRSNRQGLQRDALSDLMRYSQMLLGERPFERVLQEPPPKEFQQKQKTEKGVDWGGLLGSALPGLLSLL